MSVLDLAPASALPDLAPVVSLRAIRDDDDERLRRMFYRCSRETIYRRFFSYSPQPREWMLRRLAHVDHVNRYAVVATVDDEVVGVARFDKVGAGDEAEIAVCVEDAWQRQGVARSLLAALLDAARRRGVATVVAEIQSENAASLRLMLTALPHPQVVPAGTTSTVRSAI